MPIDFTLTSYQRRLQRIAREFSNEILAPVIRSADENFNPQAAFRATKAAYVEGYKLGFATGFIPKKYGGGGDFQSRSSNCRGGNLRGRLQASRPYFL